MEDIFNRCLDASDPVIANYSLKRRLSQRKNVPLSPKAVQLLKPPQIQPCAFETENQDDVDAFDICLETETDPESYDWIVQDDNYDSDITTEESENEL